VPAASLIPMLPRITPDRGSSSAWLFPSPSSRSPLWLWNEQNVAFAVSFSLFAASSTATLVAMVLPWFLTRLGKDPAFSSGPLATVIQDLFSILIYFATASAIVD
jgi:Mg/Co/Ni transporter MgtE